MEKHRNIVSIYTGLVICFLQIYTWFDDKKYFALFKSINKDYNFIYLLSLNFSLILGIIFIVFGFKHTFYSTSDKKQRFMIFNPFVCRDCLENKECFEEILYPAFIVFYPVWYLFKDFPYSDHIRTFLMVLLIIIVLFDLKTILFALTSSFAICGLSHALSSSGITSRITIFSFFLYVINTSISFRYILSKDTTDDAES